jgi:hypothetical protein
LTGTQAKPGRAQHHAEQTNKYKDGISFNNKREKAQTFGTYFRGRINTNVLTKVIVRYSFLRYI